MKKFQLKSFLPFPERRILSYSLLGLTLGSGALLAVISAVNMHEYNISQLDTLQSNISKLQDSMNKPASEVNLNPMTQQIQQLSQQLDDVRAQISIDYGTQRIEFENTKKEHVLVTLENIGSGEL